MIRIVIEKDTLYVCHVAIEPIPIRYKLTLNPSLRFFFPHIKKQTWASTLRTWPRDCSWVGIFFWHILSPKLCKKLRKCTCENCAPNDCVWLLTHIFPNSVVVEKISSDSLPTPVLYILLSTFNEVVSCIFVHIFYY